MVEIKNLSFGYRKNRPLFNDLSLEFQGGHIYGLLGKNGAGKTTLFKIISGLVFPRGGKVQSLGLDPGERTPAALQGLFFLPETFRLPAVSGRRYESMFAPFYPSFDGARFEGLLGRFELEPRDRLDRLSHGQRKKFLIAFGLATDCRILLMDEPTNGLDIPGKSAFRAMIAGEIRDDRFFVIATHQVRDVENLIDSVVLIESGRIVFQRSMGDVARQLRFSPRGDSDAGRDILYAARTPAGEAVVTRNRTGDDSPVDLEMLFNAVVRDPEAVASAFEKREERP
jgi:ABC-2 type transport system ATP-binding protein